MNIVAMALRMVDPTSPAIPQGQPGLTSGQWFFLFLIVLGGACYLLYRSMKRQIGKIQISKDGQ